MLPGFEGRRHGLRQEDRPHRKASGDRLGEREDVGHNPGPLIGKEVTGAPETALDFVEDEGDASIPRHLSQERQQARVDDAHAALTLDRLDDHGSHRLRVEHRLELALVPLRDRDPSGEGTEGQSVSRTIGGRDTREQSTVKGTTQRNDFVLGGRIGRPGPFARELEGALVGFRPRVAEEDAIGERALHERRRQSLARLRPEQVRGVDQPALQCRLDRRADPCVVVAQRVDRDAAGQIEKLVTVRIDEHHAIPAHDRHGRALVRECERVGSRRFRGERRRRCGGRGRGRSVPGDRHGSGPQAG